MFVCSPLGFAIAGRERGFYFTLLTRMAFRNIRSNGMGRSSGLFDSGLPRPRNGVRRFRLVPGRMGDCRDHCVGGSKLKLYNFHECIAIVSVLWAVPETQVRQASADNP